MGMAGSRLAGALGWRRICLHIRMPGSRCHAEKCAISARVLFGNAAIAPSLPRSVLPRKNVCRRRMFGEGAREGEAVVRQSSEPARPGGSTGRILRPQAALAVPEPPRETVERGRKVATVCAEGEAEPLRRHFLLWRGTKISELDHAAQLLVARAGEEGAWSSR